MPSLSQGERHRKTQALSQLRMVRKTRDSRCFQKVGAKSENIQEGGSGKEVLLRILSVKVNGTGATSA